MRAGRPGRAPPYTASLSKSASLWRPEAISLTLAPLMSQGWSLAAIVVDELEKEGLALPGASDSMNDNSVDMAEEVAKLTELHREHQLAQAQGLGASASLISMDVFSDGVPSYFAFVIAMCKGSPPCHCPTTCTTVFSGAPTK
jgi:hypothetical protein